MPRSLLEFEAEMPDVSLIPYAVSSAQPDTLWSERLPSLNGEFVKYIASTVRLAIAGHGAAASDTGSSSGKDHSNRTGGTREFRRKSGG